MEERYGFGYSVKEKREKRERRMEEEVIQVMDRIELEMEDMIKCRLLNEREKSENKFVSEKVRSSNPYLLKDKYLEMKYLIQREHTYLKLITNFNANLITYITDMFSKEEVQISKFIKEALIDYADAYIACYDGQSEILKMKVSQADELDSEKEVKKELSMKLLSLIPK